MLLHLFSAAALLLQVFGVVSTRAEKGKDRSGLQEKLTEQTTVVCKTCRKDVATKPGNTINRFNHQKIKHVIEYNECIKQKRAGNVVSNVASRTPLAAPVTSTKQTSPMFRYSRYDRMSNK